MELVEVLQVLQIVIEFLVRAQDLVQVEVLDVQTVHIHISTLRFFSTELGLFVGRAEYYLEEVVHGVCG